MADKKPEPLIVEELPQKTRRGGGEYYQNRINEFLGLNVQSARVPPSKTKDASVAIGLKKAILALGLGDEVRVARRTVGVYLERIGEL